MNFDLRGCVPCSRGLPCSAHDWRPGQKRAEPSLGIVTVQQANICLMFLSDQHNDGEPLDGVPKDILELVQSYGECSAIESARQAYVIAQAVIAIEAWLVSDRAACIATLGPGLGLDQ